MEEIILNEIALISIFVTSAALNGLNVTMGYCVKFVSKCNALIFCF